MLPMALAQASMVICVLSPQCRDDGPYTSVFQSFWSYSFSIQWHGVTL